MANSKMSSCTFFFIMAVFLYLFKKIIIVAVSLPLFRSHRGRLGERSMGDQETGELVSALTLMPYVRLPRVSVLCLRFLQYEVMTL